MNVMDSGLVAASVVAPSGPAFIAKEYMAVGIAMAKNKTLLKKFFNGNLYLESTYAQGRLKISDTNEQAREFNIA